MWSTIRLYLRSYMQLNHEDIGMIKPVIIGATLTALLTFPLSSIASGSDLKHRNHHIVVVSSHTGAQAKHVIRTDYRKVRERVKADSIRRHRYAVNHHKQHKRLRRGEHYWLHHHYPQYHPSRYRPHVHGLRKDYLDQLIVLHLVDNVYHNHH